MYFIVGQMHYPLASTIKLFSQAKHQLILKQV